MRTTWWAIIGCEPPQTVYAMYFIKSHIQLVHVAEAVRMHIREGSQ